MKWWFLIWLLSSSMLSAQNPSTPFSTTWNIGNEDSIAGFSVIKSDSPQVIDSEEYGKVTWFDGIDDGLLVESNPLDGATNLAIEVIFKPDSSWPANEEQRFIHIQDPANNDRRILIELRLTDDHQWYLDTYIKSEVSSKALKLETALHPVGQWYHAALVYDNRSMKHFVNGIEEISGEVDYLPITNAFTSIGTRMDQRSWFKGCIAILKITHSALQPENFIKNITSVKENSFLKKNYKLRQNYPNPFNPITMIRYQISRTNNVDLSIYNLLGQKVATIVSEKQSPGKYQVRWDASTLGNGVYYYRLSTDKYSDIKKMIFLK
jgi:hypothetical protein